MRTTPLPHLFLQTSSLSLLTFVAHDFRPAILQHKFHIDRLQNSLTNNRNAIKLRSLPTITTETDTSTESVFYIRSQIIRCPHLETQKYCKRWARIAKIKIYSKRLPYIASPNTFQELVNKINIRHSSKNTHTAQHISPQLYISILQIRKIRKMSRPLLTCFKIPVSK